MTQLQPAVQPTPLPAQVSLQTSLLLFALKRSQLSGATESQESPLLQVWPMVLVPTSPVTPPTESGRQNPTGSGKFAQTMPEGH